MRILLAALLALVPAAALAGTPADVKKMNTDDCARARAAGKTCVINIEGIDVEGLKVGSTGERFTAPDFGKAGSLIKLRRDFIPEILKSAEDLP
jgi:hypothetical protein